MKAMKKSSIFRENLSKKVEYRLLPHVVTVMALCAGVSSIRFALLGKPELAVLSVILAAIFDTMDGRLARMLNTSSLFGAELDSLADFANFGVVPAILMYMCFLPQDSKIGWVCCLFFTVCSALRLARFNLIRIEEEEGGASSHFIGVPSPMGAMIAILPLILSFEFSSVQSWKYFGWFSLVGAGVLMISRLKVFSFKKFTLPKNAMAPILCGVGIMTGGMLQAPWLTISGGILIYIASIVVSVIKFREPANKAKILMFKDKNKEE